jgi:putative glycosyltransferase (TIGR04372 family)
LNSKFPGGKVHNIGSNVHNDRDIFNLLATSSPHLSFTEEEEERGRKFLRSIGIPEGQPFVCLNVRDSAYYGVIGASNDKHEYRDSSIENYVMAAEAIARRGFFVLRMGRSVHRPLVSRAREIIDYAYQQMGNDFLDVYLGANCHMCLSSGSGFDAIPAIFRRPVSLVNLCPIEAPASSQNYRVYTGRAHFDATTGKQLTLRQIVARGLAWTATTSAYKKANIVLKENEPHEIVDVAIETLGRIDGTWRTDSEGERLQNAFRQIMPLDSRNRNDVPLHGQFFIRYSESYLKENQWWLE